ncbi:MAG TPA: hypothetical protein VME66_13405 [Candidatus Acidoferrales bacterium]|nr:hypothetical protein [Candidatus Acidoferrales bacterium]
MVFALAALSCAPVSAAQVGAAHSSVHAVHRGLALNRFAPADEYFGPLKLSILGIRNQIHDIGLAYDANPNIANAAFGKAVMTEASLRDWERKYPLDPDLARHVYLLSHLYQKFALVEAQVRARATQAWLLGKYPHTWYAKDERRRIAYRATHPQAVAASQPSTAATPFGVAPLNGIAPVQPVAATP